MSVVLRIIELLVLIVNVWILFSVLFFLVISCWGFGKQRPYKKHAPATRFLVFVPACNEARVIEDALRSIQSSPYPRDLIELCVIADNCTDDTVEIAERCGARVFRTFSKPGEPIGKPHAIKKVLDQHPEMYEQYDLLVILDADNLITENFFRELNSQYIDCGKPAAIQVYPACKNRKGLIAFFYYHNYTVNNRFYQLAKSKLGLNNALCGTGMALSLRALSDMGGWAANSLTEDMELQIKLTLRGERILWNHEVKIFDEKPTRLSTSFRQRMRWAQGHWYVALHNAKPLVKACLHKTIPLKELVSSLCFVFSMPLCILMPLLALQLPLVALVDPVSTMTYVGFGQTWVSSVVMTLPLLYTLFVLFFIADWLDNRRPFRISTFFYVLFSFLIAYPLGIVAQMLGLIKHRNQSIWSKTEHEISADDPQASFVQQETVSEYPKPTLEALEPMEHKRPLPVNLPKERERSVV